MINVSLQYAFMLIYVVHTCRDLPYGQLDDNGG
jgi:hypothetical protein